MTLELYRVYSGKEFNILTEGTQFIKMLNNEERHNGMQYKTGLNKDTVPFNGSGRCSDGGLYFSKLSKCNLYMDHGTIMRLVTIPDDAMVYIEGNKFKADMIILSERVYLDDEKIFNQNLCLQLIEKYPRW